jgi:hypothetical protein
MDEVFANPLIELEQYGCIYFCTGCCAEAGAFVLMVPKIEVAYLKAAVDGLESSLRIAQQENAFLRGLLDARITSAGYDEPSVHVPASFPFSEVESVSDDIDSIIDGLQPESH